MRLMLGIQAAPHRDSPSPRYRHHYAPAASLRTNGAAHGVDCPVCVRAPLPCLQDADEYENKAAHVELTKKMKKRDPATAPAVGDRVPYVIIKVGGGSRGLRHVAMGGGAEAEASTRPMTLGACPHPGSLAGSPVLAVGCLPKLPPPPPSAPPPGASRLPRVPRPMRRPRTPSTR